MEQMSFHLDLYNRVINRKTIARVKLNMGNNL